MNIIKSMRQEKKITQAQLAQMLGMSLRSYKTYENDSAKIGTIKYNYIIDKLQQINPLDEEHGILTTQEIQDICGEVLREYPVHYCILFGSYARETAKETSDVDLLVVSDVRGIQFFGLVEKLRNRLHKKVDVLDFNQIKINPELTNEILRDGIRIYAKRKN